MTTTIVRDFAYKPDDPRFNGIYPTVETKKKPIEPEVDTNVIVSTDDNDDDDSDDEKDWEWQWSYFTISDKKSIATVDITDFKYSVLHQLHGLFKEKLKLDVLEFYRAKTVFPFVKGTDYEMTLESSDELLVFSTIKSIEPPKDMNSRWSSIDDLGSSKKPKDLKKVLLEFEPPLDDFCKEIIQFLGYNKNYGDGWLTALKVRVFGSWKTGKAIVKLKDLGLVPGNYIEPCE
ncbi:hypothetical protein BC833DRAFT_623282 [Globomyces pollinis-pini]|nr:hypothetical protein BC833DRAFT_623282 [Globomyces pollinis-pini]